MSLPRRRTHFLRMLKHWNTYYQMTLLLMSHTSGQLSSSVHSPAADLYCPIEQSRLWMALWHKLLQIEVTNYCWRSTCKHEEGRNQHFQTGGQKKSTNKWLSMAFFTRLIRVSYKNRIACLNGFEKSYYLSIKLKIDSNYGHEWRMIWEKKKHALLNREKIAIN